MVRLLFEYSEGAAGQLINKIDTNIGRQRFQSIADNTHHCMIQITNCLQKINFIYFFETGKGSNIIEIIRSDVAACVVLDHCRNFNECRGKYFVEKRAESAVCNKL
jgi:hypothetical protein